MLKIVFCKQADREHKVSKRQYAHVGHHRNTICVSESIQRIPDKNKVAIIAHEVGHVISIKVRKDDSEVGADNMVYYVTNVEILYEDSLAGKEVECIEKKDLGTLLEFITGMVDSASLKRIGLYW